MRVRSSSRVWLIPASAVYSALLALLRDKPTVESDAGIYLSVAGRILHGDRLYVDVLDNKDPLFYYGHTVAFWIAGWRGPFLLDVVWLAIAAASTFLLLRAVGASQITAVVGFLAYPLLLTGITYLPGYSQLAGLSFAPLIALLWVRGKLVAAGALIALGVLFKINLGLVVISIPAALLLIRVPPGSVRSHIARAAAGFVAVLGAAAVFLALRGELHGYLNVLHDNLSYSQDALADTGRPSGAFGHVREVANTFGRKRTAILGLAFLAVAVLATRVIRDRRTADDRANGPSARVTLAALFLSTAAAASITLALTAVWESHSQMLALPGLLLIAFVLVLIREPPAGTRNVIAGCALGALVFVLLGGLYRGNPDAPGSLSNWFKSGQSETANMLEYTADQRFPHAGEVSFVHLGQADEEAAGAFLDDRFTLACPQISQYPSSTDLPAPLDCVEEKRPQLVLVTPTFRQFDFTPAKWNQFVERGQGVLGQDYEPVASCLTGLPRSLPNPGPVTVWALREPGGPPEGTPPRTLDPPCSG